MQEIKFALHLNLSESYIYGTATLDGKDYPINIQQAAKQMIVLPPDFSYIGEIDKALISFNNDNNDKKISMASEIQVGEEILSKYILIGTICSYPLQMTFQWRYPYIWTLQYCKCIRR